MNQDLYDKVREAISEEVGGGDPELDYATVEAIRAFGVFLRSRQWYSVPEMIQELRDMMLQPCGDFRDGFDEILKEY